MKVTVATTLFVLFSLAVCLSSASGPELRPSRKYTKRRKREVDRQNDTAMADSNASGDDTDADGLLLIPSSGSAAEEDYYSPEACDAHFKMSLSKLQGISLNCAESVPFSDCCQLKFLGVKKTGAYRIAGELAWCDMETDDGGWLVFQRRMGGRRNFYKNWKQYARGFGVLDRDFWLGLETLHMLTTAVRTELRVDLRFANGTAVFAHYHTFHVANERDNYRLTATDYDSSSTVDDAFSAGLNPHNGLEFTTYDRDNDGNFLVNCAVLYELTGIGGGGWWYNNCGNTLPNSNYYYDEDDPGVIWVQGGEAVRFPFMEMKMRPKIWHCSNMDQRSLEDLFIL